jgi:hypothetical protein
MSGDDFLRDAVARAGDEIAGEVPSDLAGRLEARRTRIVRRRTATRVLAAAAIILVIGGVALQFGADDEDAVETVDLPTTVAPTTATSVTTEATAPAATTTAPTDTTTTEPATTTQPTTTTVPPPTVSPIGPSTPISLYGIGQIRAGMTIAEAEAATGQTFTVDGFDMAGGSCYFARVDGIEDLLFLVTSDAGPTGDPRQGVIGRVTVSVPGRTTISGISIGSTRAEVLDTYGDRITESQHAYVTDGSYLDYTSPDPADAGFMVRFEVADGAVRDIHAGHAREAGYIEGCA